MKKDPIDRSHLESELHYLYGHVNEMLKFAEAKNAGLIALNIVIIIGILQSTITDSSYVLVKFSGIYAVLVNTLSVFFLLIAIYAQLREHSKPPVMDDSENLLYFGTIAKYTPEQLISNLTEKYGFISINQQFDIDLARQVIIISQITKRKFKLFNIAMVFTLASLPPGIILYWVFEKWFNPNK